MAQMVLVADDSPTIQKRAQGILKGEGFEVETVSNGVAAIKRIAVIQPVVVLADVSMPGRDGYEVCDFVKKSPEFSHVPVLLVASDMEPYDEARGAQVRADGKIKKPFEPQELISMVTKFAAQSEAAAKPGSARTVITAPFPEAPPEPAPEFALAREEPPVEEPPPAPQPVTPDFSAVSEGVAFAEPTSEEAPAYSPEPVTAEWQTPLAAPLEPTVRWDTVPEIPDVFPAPEPAAAPPAETPVPLDQPQTEPPEPVFIEEKTLPLLKPPSFPAEPTTMIFRAPAEIAEPVWRDETVPPPPEPEPTSAAAPESPSEPETPVATAEPPVEQPAPSHLETPAVAATSLDSFSLDDAAAGQVRLTPHESEAGQTAAAEPSTETAPAETPAEIPAPPPALDWAMIHSIVQQVVVRMSPPALPAEVLEGMARKIADEIASELGVASSQTQP